jgi:hypothetical protein
MTIVDHDEAEHKRQARDESSLDNMVSCKFYNRQTHGLSAEADRELLANNNTLSASLSTGSVMVVAGPEMAAAGVWGELQMGPMATALANGRLVLFALCARPTEPGEIRACQVLTVFPPSYPQG